MDKDRIKLFREFLAYYIAMVEGLTCEKIKYCMVDFGCYKVVYRADPEKGVKVYEENED